MGNTGEYEDEFDEMLDKNLWSEEEESKGLFDNEDTGEFNTPESGDVVEESSSVESEVEGARISNSGNVKEITQAEHDRLQEELASKKSELDKARVILEDARAAGDLSENETFSTYVEIVAGLEADIATINSELKNSVVSKKSTSNQFIGVGSRVHLKITSPTNIIPPQDLEVSIASEGHGGIVPETGEVRVPTNSEVYRNMADRQVGSFDLIGTDGNNYHYEFNILRG